MLSKSLAPMSFTWTRKIETKYRSGNRGLIDIPGWNGSINSGRTAKRFRVVSFPAITKRTPWVGGGSGGKIYLESDAKWGRHSAFGKAE